MIFRRIALVGSPCSGKSTLAEAWGEITGLPIVHLDALLWNPGGTLASEEAFARTHAALLAQDQWLIEGLGYPGLLSPRLERAEQIVFLDTPLDVCLERAEKKREAEKLGDFVAVPRQDGAGRSRHAQFVEHVHASGRLLLLKLLGEDFAFKPQIRLDGRLPVEELCAKLRGLEQSGVRARPI
ncbi:hypothetical protein [Chondromyces crocatus]|uniref:Adenylate kinase n=1 Tax=Chondromyces crocatus TaxID=52 RepID=A0A0K1E8L0_CHOCO|nr:hypothetical protein [Chondromyces crocatus]AKT36918.1 uncharacterized protein CMC5_010390 [Chondromyces crocatus]